ncbi:MAG: hypothetical protein GX808_14490 [Syntrophomonadaceae bacterium]|nr:hypothetical protein [Syntrophomonadaceae bacterium]
MIKNKISIFYLSIILTSITFLISLASLLYQDIYTKRINQITHYELMGQDLVTLVVSSLFLLVIYFMDYNKIKTKIIWLGCLMYIFYIYAYFSFGGITSVFYILYLAIAGLSLFLFFALIIDIARKNMTLNIIDSYPRKTISIYFIISILIVTFIELSELISKTILLQGELNPYYVFYVLDLSFIFPFIIIIAILNYKKVCWGFLLSGVALIKIITILPAVIFNDIFYRIYTGKFIDLGFDVIASVITIIGAIVLYFYLRSIDNNETSGTSHNMGFKLRCRANIKTYL